MPGLEIERVDQLNVSIFAITKLRAFSDDDALPEETQVASETALRQAELRGEAGGTIVTADGECVGSMWWYDEPEAIWIVLLSVRAVSPSRHCQPVVVLPPDRRTNARQACADQRHDEQYLRAAPLSLAWLYRRGLLASSLQPAMILVQQDSKCRPIIFFCCDYPRYNSAGSQAEAV